jgi:prepilin-type N-terminal cleavage/methylation domain-containing protein
MTANDRRSQGGFTLIELLIVVVVIGILAAIAIPKFANTKGKAYTSAMITDLRNLTTAQEAFFSDSSTYFGGTVPTTGFMAQPSGGVSLTLQNVSATGWGATASHAATAKTCAVYFGSSAPIAPATREGVPMCTP